jgi:hypothetical protein
VNNSRWDDLSSENERLVESADPRRRGSAALGVRLAGRVACAAGATATAQARHEADPAHTGSWAVRSLAARTRRWRATRSTAGR